MSEPTAHQRSFEAELRAQGLDSHYSERLAEELADHLECMVEALALRANGPRHEIEHVARLELGAVETIAAAVIQERVPNAVALAVDYEHENMALRWSMSIGTSAAFTTITLFVLQAIVLGS